MENKYFRKLPLILSTTYVGLMAYPAFIEPYSRQRLDPRERLSQWTDAFKSCLVPMASLCVLTALSGALQYSETRNINWAIGTGLITAILPYTALVIKPVYDKILDADKK